MKNSWRKVRIQDWQEVILIDLRYDLPLRELAARCERSPEWTLHALARLLGRREAKRVERGV